MADKKEKADKTEAKADKASKRKEYEKELQRLQGELCKLQDWVKYKGLRVIVIFEGRDAAGKGGTIRALTERVIPAYFVWSPYRPVTTAKNPKCICSDICFIFRPRAKS